MACAISLRGQKLVYFKPFERLIGNISYCQGDYKVGRVPVEVPLEVWGEVLVCCILMPLMQHNLDSPYCERLESYDAAPGGHGRAWA
eukprot:218515-Heterocapsa_arctica.AAC.1